MKAILTFITLTLSAAIASAAQTTLTDEFLLGKWSTGSLEDCAAGLATYVVFHPNHTLEAGKGNAVSTVGFWQIDNDRVILHLLVAPSPGREAHPFYQQNYYYQNMAPRVLAVRPDSIDYTHDTDVESGNKGTVTRCRQRGPAPQR